MESEREGRRAWSERVNRAGERARVRAQQEARARHQMQDHTWSRTVPLRRKLKRWDGEIRGLSITPDYGWAQAWDGVPEAYSSYA